MDQLSGKTAAENEDMEITDLCFDKEWITIQGKLGHALYIALNVTSSNYLPFRL